MPNTLVIVRFFLARLCPTAKMSIKKRNPRLIIYEYLKIIQIIKIIQIFLTKLIRPTLTKALLQRNRFCLMEDASYFSQSSWGSFCPGALFAESTGQLFFIIKLVAVMMEKGFGR